MKRIFSNGPSKDFVINPFLEMVAKAHRLHIAAPYVTETDELLTAAKKGRVVDLLVGLNSSTSPQALEQVINVPNLSVRYLTHRFHAKIYIFDGFAMLGSSNLTDGGLKSNREATICLDQSVDADSIEELKSLFLELWNYAAVLTPDKLKHFRSAYEKVKSNGYDPDSLIEREVGRVEPANINVASVIKNPQQLFIQDLQKQVYEQYIPAFNEVKNILVDKKIRRTDLEDVGISNETNRFLNWVRLTYAKGDESWQHAPIKSEEDRRSNILRLGTEWSNTDKSKIPEDYVDWLRTVQETFGSDEAISTASKERLTKGLTSLHAFSEQLRFVKGGAENLPKVFWNTNQDDLNKVKKSLILLVHGSGDFIERLHDFLYSPSMKLSYFGKFCALELFGTIKPDECPPMNGRMAKALRYLGYNVRGT